MGNVETPAPGQLWTAEQLATRWQVPTSHVYNLARAGDIPVVRLGRYVRFRLEAIEDFERGEGVDRRPRR